MDRSVGRRLASIADPRWRRLPSAAARCLVLRLLGLAPVRRPRPRRPGRSPKAAKAVVPFEMLPTNHMLVQAKINGKGPFRLIFDLGAPITLLSNRAGEAVGRGRGRRPAHAFLFGMRGEAEIDKLEVGDLTAREAAGDRPRPSGPEGAGRRPRPAARRHHRLHLLRPVQDDDRLPGPEDDLRAGRLTRSATCSRISPTGLPAPRSPGERVLAPSGVWGIRAGPAAGGLDAPGVPMPRSIAGSPAAAGGLKPGDVLTTLDGRWTTSISGHLRRRRGRRARPRRRRRHPPRRQGETLTVTPRPKGS